MAGPIRRLAIVAAIPILLWGAWEALDLFKVRAPGVPSLNESSGDPDPAGALSPG